jgi:hypothetical protein
MAAEPKKDLAASIRQRLLNLAKERREDFDLMLARYALERLLYRLSASPHGMQFLLKGALLFLVWGVDDHRPTRDADLLSSGDSGTEALAKVFREVCAVQCDDGIGGASRAFVGVRKGREEEGAVGRVPASQWSGGSGPLTHCDTTGGGQARAPGARSGAQPATMTA